MKWAINSLLCCVAIAAAASPGPLKGPFAGVIAKRTTLPIDGVNAEIRIPSVSPPCKSDKETFGGQIVLGLDTFNCSTPTLVGIQFSVKNRRTQYRLFYQWLSGKPVFVDNVAIKAGDDLRFGIQGDEYLLNDTPYNGTIYFTNYSNGQNTTIDTKHKVPACANNAAFVFEPLGTYRIAKFSPIELSDVYYVANYGTFVHGIAVSDGTTSYNLTNSAGKKLVTTIVDGVAVTFKYAA